MLKKQQQKQSPSKLDGTRLTHIWETCCHSGIQRQTLKKLKDQRKRLDASGFIGTSCD